MRFALMFAFAACAAPAPTSLSTKPATGGPVAAAQGQLLPPTAFAGIADRAARSRAEFVEMAKVLTHPRCVNCHPADDSPRQRDAHEPHDPPVVRGVADRGVPAMQCTSCHQDRNAAFARVPGAPDWHLAPRSMAWLGRSPREICETIKDPARNGKRTLAQLQNHLAHDAIVAWAWAPGADRAPAPGSQAELGALVQAWIDSGAECPP